MRFGMWAAAAAALVCAGQAGAATFVQYEAQGTGFVSRQDTSSAGYSTKYGDFTFDFVLEVDPGYSSGQSSGNGSQYSYQSGPNDTFLAKISSGVLSINGQYIASGRGGYGYSATINLPAFNTFSFSEIPAATQAAGLVSYNTGSALTGAINYSGAITSLFKVGTVAGFIEPTVSVLPEPATWAMMIIGFGLVGTAMRRRRLNQRPALD